MSKLKNKKIGITMGDPSGIGPEVIAESLKRLAPRFAKRFVLIGDAAIFRRYWPEHGAHVAVCDVPMAGLCKPGQPSPQGGKASLRFLEMAVALLKNGVLDGLVTAPVCKESVALFEKKFHGHTEYLAGAFGVAQFDMMFAAPAVRAVIVTRHVALTEVPKLITAKNVHGSIELAHRSLKDLFKIRKPKIAVLGLNPHAGEHGLMGREEQRAIGPAIAQANREGIDAKGPFPADTFFIKSNPFDCVVAMYHDQGLIPMKTLYSQDVVNVTIGLPFVRTSPAHGTAFDIAGKNRADASSMRAAMQLACRLV